MLCDAFFEILSKNQEKIRDFIPSNPENLHRLQILLDYLHEHYEENIQLQELSNRVHLSRETCCRLFKQENWI